MKIIPSLDEVLELARSGQYRTVPLSCEILSDICTPIEALRILKNLSRHCYLLESVTENERWGRYTFLGFDPKLEIRCLDGKMNIGDITLKTDHPSDYLRQILSQHKSPRFSSRPPCTGGRVGYFSYDYLKYSEPSVRRDTLDTEAFQDMDLMLFDKVIAFDNLRQKIILIVNMPLTDPETGYNKAVQELSHLASILRSYPQKTEPAGRLLGEVTPLFDRSTYCSMVEKAKKYIHEGDRAAC